MSTIESGRGVAGTVTSLRTPPRPETFGTKRCPACRTTKPLSAFNREKRRKSGVQSRCRECQNASKREKRLRNPPTTEQRDKARANHARWKAKNPDKIREQHLRRKASPAWEGVKARSRETMLAKYHERRKVIAAAKSEAGCILCLEREPCALDLHHVSPEEKSFAVGNDFTSKPWRRIVSEAAKCVVLCANCHRKLHEGIVQLPSHAPRLVLDTVDPGLRIPDRRRWTASG